MNEIFDFCVQILFQIADIFDITYKEANVWVFVILEPIIFIILLLIILKQRITIKKLK